LYNISNVTHLKEVLAKRFVKFCSSLKNSQKPEILHLFCIQKSGVRSTFSYNCHKFMEELKVYSVDEINCKNISMFKIPEEGEWRIPFLFNLIHLRKGSLENIDINKKFNTMIDFICCQ